MKNISSRVTLKSAESLLWNMPSAVSGDDLVFPFHSIASGDYSKQSELLAKCHAINSTINAPTRAGTWYSVVERSSNNIVKDATWKKVLNTGDWKNYSPMDSGRKLLI